jgi:hypothetical protein
MVMAQVYMKAALKKLGQGCRASNHHQDEATPADIVGMVMAQVYMKAALKKLGQGCRASNHNQDEATPLVQLLQAHALA